MAFPFAATASEFGRSHAAHSDQEIDGTALETGNCDNTFAWPPSQSGL